MTYLFRTLCSLCALWLIFAACGCHKKNSTAERVSKAPAEFRGLWVATVGNIDWPSKPGLSTAEQQREALAILDKAASLNFNVIVFQVRTTCDAFYESKLEPWSYYLTGEQGRPPEPFYDPLKFWVDESHKRGMELHAWFNPFRARYAGAKYEESPSHASKTHPKLVKKYGTMLWMDPGEPDSRAHTLNVVKDVVRRYDVDGVHIDDYFYPYPVKAEGGGEAPFPDDESWNRFGAGGSLKRNDWRRENINHLIEEMYRSAHEVKKNVKFGISPFGIPRPGHPPIAKGFDQYEKLYADTELWLREGWCDYWAPQLYWKTTAPNQPYRDLLDYWIANNPHRVQICPGLFTSRLGEGAGNEKPWPADEIVKEIAITRATPGARGNIHFSAKALMRDYGGIGEQLRTGPYAKKARVPQPAEFRK